MTRRRFIRGLEDERKPPEDTSVPGDSIDDRLDRLRLARSNLVARLEDERTPAYSIAPLSNQLRLTDVSIERLTRLKEPDPENPSPALMTYLDLLLYLRVRRHGLPLYGKDRVWADAGFDPKRPSWWGQSRGDEPPEEQRERQQSWLERCRAELARCLDHGAS